MFEYDDIDWRGKASKQIKFHLLTQAGYVAAIQLVFIIMVVMMIIVST